MLVSLATSPASADRPNEDFVAAEAGTVVLLDGAGIPPGMTSGCRHGVAWFTRRLGAQLLLESGETPRQPLTDCLASAIAHVRTLHEAECDLTHAGSPSATIVAVRRSHDHLEYLVLGDSVLILDSRIAGPVVVTDDREAKVGRAHRKAMDALPTGSPEHTRTLRTYVETLNTYRNAEGGFWIASTEPSAANHALTGTVPIDELRAIALLSDGASRLTDRFDLLDWPDLLKLLTRDDAGELLRCVRAAENTDPHGERWPRGKAHDDATVAYVTFSI